MAIMHMDIKPICRSKGRSATAAAAYRSGDKITDERTGIVHDYSRRTGVESSTMIFPPEAGAVSRSQIWNMAEAAERRKDSRVAREVEIALPHELSPSQRKALVLNFTRKIVEKYGVAADISIHRPNPKGDQKNHHAHILLTTRKIGQDGLGDKSDLELEDKALRAAGKPAGRDQVKAIREAWADEANQALKLAGYDVRIDPRSYKDQGLDIEPQIKLGSAVIEMERRGVLTDKGILNREIQKQNQARTLIENAKENRPTRNCQTELPDHNIQSLNESISNCHKLYQVFKQIETRLKRVSQRAKDSENERLKARANLSSNERQDIDLGYYKSWKDKWFLSSKKKAYLKAEHDQNFYQTKKVEIEDILKKSKQDFLNASKNLTQMIESSSDEKFKTWFSSLDDKLKSFERDRHQLVSAVPPKQEPRKKTEPVRVEQQSYRSGPYIAPVPVATEGPKMSHS